jgi:NAD(P)-dependent dehydrogenase (short-subunit alcohol dehydrogenase family)
VSGPDAAIFRPDLLEGRVALVTGGGTGIGLGIASCLAAAGATVAIASRKPEHLEAAAAELRSRGARVSTVETNVREPDAVARMVEQVAQAHGRLDILVNNAGITVDRTVLKMTDDDWRRVIEVNLSGAFYLSQAALRHMLERGSGRIVMISSVIGEMGGIGQSNYASAKAGLLGLTKTLAREAAMQVQRSGKADGLGITVNAVTPGYTATEMLATVPEKVLDGLKAKIPLGRLGEPEEVARVVHFLAADASAYITGQVWGVNGGLDM